MDRSIDLAVQHTHCAVEMIDPRSRGFEGCQFFQFLFHWSCLGLPKQLNLHQGCYRVLVSLISWPGQLLSLNPCRRPNILARRLSYGDFVLVILEITAYDTMSGSRSVTKNLRPYTMCSTHVQICWLGARQSEILDL